MKEREKMKKNAFGAILTLGTIFFTINAWASPEKLEIKTAGKRNKEQAAKAQIKTVDLRNIEDPEARKVIREILNYLDLSAKN